MKTLKSCLLLLSTLVLTSCGPTEVVQPQNEEVPQTNLENTSQPPPGVPEEYGYVVDIGDAAPTFTAEYAAGGKITPADFEGKVVMLQFTASWCSVCHEMMPHIEADIWQKYKDRDDFVLIAIDRDEDRATVVEFQNQAEITYPLVLDPGAKIFQLFAAEDAGVTRNVVIDRDGKIVFLTRLYKEDEFEQMKRVIDDLMS